MSESETTEPFRPSTTKATPDETAKSERKRVRHRKKQLYERILRQMEFYFSDANLTKDRFLSELTRADPAVPIEVFLKFNKIRALTDSVSEISKAISSSKLLVCSDDKSKVRRVTPVRAYDAELRTVYVESVPAKASREWLEEVFREYGRVAYISLPKFNNSQRIKGFAFVEFEKPEDAQKCLSAFTKMGCKLPTCMPPEDLSTIKTFSADQPDDSISQSDKSTPNTPTEESKSLADCLIKEEQENQKRSNQENQNDLKQENKVKMNQENKDNVNQENTDKLNQDKKKGGNKEQRKRQAEPVQDEPPKKKQKGNKKKRRNETPEVKQTAEDPSDMTIEEQSKKTHDSTTKDQVEDSAASSQDESSKAEQKSKKKCRKRTAKERNKSKSNLGNTEAPKPVLWGLQVLSKTEWRVLRNKYLNLQRKHMKELKNTLRMKGVHQAPAPAHTQPERRRTESEVRSTEGVRGVDRVEGVFVKVELPDPCLDVRLAKRQVRSNVHVQHVDVKEGQTDMCIRFDTPESAAQYCSSGIYASARVLRGQESQDEWTRATEARGGAGRRARGRTRLLQRAAAAAEPSVPALPSKLGEPTTHIRFDE